MRAPALLAVASIVGLSFASSAASASVVFTEGNNPQPGEENILLNQGSGTTVSGLTNQSDILVNFTSTTGQTLNVNSSGQAFITTTDSTTNNLLTSIEVTSPNHFFTDFIANPAHSSGSITVDVTTNDGVFSHVLAGGQGNNFITIVAVDGEVISSVDFTPTSGFGSFQQPRISGLSEVPIPAALPLFAGGLGVLGAFGWRKKKHKKVVAAA